MAPEMIYVAETALTIVNIFWLVGTLIMLPGNWLMLATACLAAWWGWDAGMFSPWLVAEGVLTAAGLRSPRCRRPRSLR